MILSKYTECTTIGKHEYVIDEHFLCAVNKSLYDNYYEYASGDRIIITEEIMNQFCEGTLDRYEIIERSAINAAYQRKVDLYDIIEDYLEDTAPSSYQITDVRDYTITNYKIEQE